MNIKHSIDKKYISAYFFLDKEHGLNLSFYIK